MDETEAPLYEIKVWPKTLMMDKDFSSKNIMKMLRAGQR